MRTLVISIISLLLFNSCAKQNYNVSDLQSEKLNYRDLPTEVQEFLNNPRAEKYKQYTADGTLIELNDMICLECDDYIFETVFSSIVSSWVDYYKLIDLEDNKIYRINHGHNYHPFIVFKDKLYISTEYDSLDTENLEFKCYKLK